MNRRPFRQPTLHWGTAKWPAQNGIILANGCAKSPFNAEPAQVSQLRATPSKINRPARFAFRFRR
jgi:hypothetical protein